MSKADEMFEELGYIKTFENKTIIEYSAIKYLGANCKIVFWLNTKEISTWSNLSETKPIDMKELQAINEKVKELGWNE